MKSDEEESDEVDELATIVLAGVNGKCDGAGLALN